ncbi:DUF3842 family protein [Diplocloster agilis]|uniref:DUF3842 family protein n=1 Tax=Diplocloster agilis TaxID=2850323 RepID=UPI0008204EAC|nr:DUF3842 family protein [Suonthocola fibrivorans]MCU6733779.1 DUF3842 family protein [Suonthocola fibrivorans]SCJ08694.1 Domain of uncharacterised function (DUF3842) [uncultured Clostridium sp.]
MRIVVIDGQGGGIGSSLVGKLKEAASPETEIIAVGTNALATSAMLKAGAMAGATGENAVVFNASRADVITGPMGILLANAMYGEITPDMAHAVSSSQAIKVLVPISQCSVRVAGVVGKPMAAYVEEVAAMILDYEN